MTQFATLHISKAKPSSSGLHAHIDRDHIPNNVDQSMIKSNIYLVDDQILSSEEYKAARSSGKILSIKDRIEKRIAEGYTAKRKIRANTVRELDVMLTGSNERMNEMQPDELKNWFNDNYKWTCERFGKANVVGFALHLDEATPHIHATIVPLTDDGRLSAKELLNGKDRKAPRGEHLRLMQDSYAEAMDPYGLSRGISAEATQVKHTTTKEYYRELNAAAQQLEPLKRTSLNFSEVKEDVKNTLSDAYMALKQAKDSKNKTINRAIANVRESTNMIGLAAQFGYKVDKLKSCRSSVQMQNDQGEKIVVSQAEKGHWHYFKMNTSERGNAVDFLRSNGETWEQITSRSTVSAILKTHATARPVIKAMPERIADLSEANRQAVQLWKTKPNKGSLSDYLYRDRGLGADMAKSLSESIKSTSTSVSFKTTLPDKDGNWKHCGHMTYARGRDGSSIKSLPKSLPKGWAFVSVGTNPSRPIIVCESPIDGLSFAKLEGLESFTVLASCGQPSKEQLEALKKLSGDRQKLIAVDNDDAGKKMKQSFAEALGINPNSKDIHIPSKFKDWNEVLQDQNKRTKKVKNQGIIRT